MSSFSLDNEAYPTLSDSFNIQYGIRSLVGFGTRLQALVHPALYPRILSQKASPKAISGRTSYFQICLAFHSYSQLIQSVFNLN